MRKQALLNLYFIRQSLSGDFSGTFPVVDNFVNNFEFFESKFCPKLTKAGMILTFFNN
jgi:hypothetical protein